MFLQLHELQHHIELADLSGMLEHASSWKILNL